MMKESKLRLKKSSILNVPFQNYPQDFIFIVNGEEYKTSRLLSDLLSPKISKTHLSDPTIDYFIINTKSTGNFSRFLEVQNFQDYLISTDEIPFILEILEALGNECFEFIDNNEVEEITMDNVFTLVKNHSKYPKTSLFLKTIVQN